MNRYEFSFMHDDAIQKFVFQSNDPNIEAVRKKVNACRGASDLQQMQFIPVDGITGKATELMDSLTEALECYLEEGDEASKAAKALRVRAETLDERAQAAKRLMPLEIEFIWDNGGDDDNPFQDGFLAASKDPEATQWMLDVGTWLDDNSFGYDVAVRQLRAIKTLPLAAEALGRALEFIKKHEPKATQLAATLQWAVLEGGLGQIPVPKATRKPRM